MRRAERQDMGTAIDNSSVLYLVKSNITMMVVVIMVIIIVFMMIVVVPAWLKTASGNYVGDDGSYVGCGVYDGNPPPVSLLFLYSLYYIYYYIYITSRELAAQCERWVSNQRSALKAGTPPPGEQRHGDQDHGKLHDQH